MGFTIHVEDKQPQAIITVSDNANSWPNDGVWRVASVDGSGRCSPSDHGKFEVGHRLLFMAYALLHLADGKLYPSGFAKSVFGRDRLQIVRDFTVAKVWLHVDNEPLP